MKHKIIFAILIVFFISILFINESTVYAGSQLQVVTAKPTGELRGIWEAEQITVTFNSAIVELQRAEGFRPDWFQIVPAVEGEFEWIGTQTFAFKPLQNLTYATRFTVTIKSNLSAIDGSKMNADYVWSFQTPTPFVRFSMPRNHEKSIDTKVAVLLDFNMPVMPADLINYVEFYETRTKQFIKFEINDGDPKAANQQYLKPLKELKMDTDYLVNVRKGLPAAEGNIGSRREWQINFRTYGDFKFIGINNGDHQPVNPHNAISLNFTNPVEYSKLIKYIKFEPAVVLEAYDYSYQQKDVYIYGPFLADTVYHVWISDSLEDIFGNPLEKSIHESFNTRSYDATYQIPAGESIIEAYGDLNIPIELVNLSKLQVKIKAISSDSLDKIGRRFLNTNHYSSDDILGKRVTRFEELNYPVKKNRRELFPFNLKKYLADGEHGNLLLQFFGKEDENSYSNYKLLLIQVTHLGITAKFSPVTNAIYVTQLKTGEPVAGVTIQIRDGSGKTYWTGKTDAIGYCESPGWQRLGMSASNTSEPVQWVIASLNGDVVYTHSEKGTGISPWEFRIPYQWRPRDEQLDAAIFTDRGIYRAEDTVHVKIVMREKYGLEWWLAERDSFLVKIADPTGKEVYEQYHMLNDFNAFDFLYPLPYDTKRGYYSIRVLLPQKLNYEQPIFESFWVEDYRPAEFEVNVQPQKAAYIFGDTVTAMISAAYLFGAPLKNAPIKWQITKSEYYPTPSGWDGYYFNPERFEAGEFGGSGTFSSNTVTQEDKLGDSGSLNVAFYLHEPDLFTSAKYILEGTVTDQNRRQISGSKEVIVYRGEYQIGIKPNSFFGETGTAYPIDFITLAHDGKLVSNRKVNLHIVRRNWYSVRKAGSGGRYFWQSEVFDSTMVRTSVTTNATPVAYNFMPPQSGYYLIRATSTDDHHRTGRHYRSFCEAGGWLHTNSGNTHSRYLFAQCVRFCDVNSGANRQ